MVTTTDSAGTQSTTKKTDPVTGNPVIVSTISNNTKLYQDAQLQLARDFKDWALYKQKAISAIQFIINEAKASATAAQVSS